MHLTCRKDCVKSPTSREGWDLFRRASDDSSIWRIVWRVQRHHWCRTFQPWRSNQEESEDHFKKNDEGKFVVPSCSRWKHRGIQGRIHSMRLLTKRRHRIRRDICNQWELRHMTGRIMCANKRRPCTSSEGTHGITHTWGSWRSPRVMKILTFATRLKMKSYRGWQAHRWVWEEILKKDQDRGYIDGYIEY